MPNTIWLILFLQLALWFHSGGRLILGIKFTNSTASAVDSGQIKIRPQKICFFPPIHQSGKKYLHS